jgi:hypothetical protein
MNTVLPQLRLRSEQLLAAGRERAVAAGVGVDTLCVECFARRTADVIVEQAASWPADLIVLGTHGRRGASRVLLGSDAEQVLRLAPVPLLLVRSADHPAESSSPRCPPRPGEPSPSRTAARAAIDRQRSGAPECDLGAARRAQAPISAS